MMKKVLLIGQDGMLGSELFQRLERKYEIVGTTLETLDICDKTAVIEKTRQEKPNFIINCAAYTNVDGCETNIELCTKVNGHAVENIAEAANEVDAILIHISTDYVFDGNLDVNKAYTEDMEPNPVSQYGKSKLLGEQNAAKASKYYILRTAWLYGQGKNFARTMIKLSKEKEFLNVVNDQHGSPTSTTTLCEIIEKIMEKEAEYGVYHSTNEGFTTWYDFAVDIFKICGISTPVRPVSSDEYPTPTKRPFNSQLSKEKLKNIGIYPINYIDALKIYLEKEGEII
jgi:dTDP-4-dehydrorhamnose reductase